MPAYSFEALDAQGATRQGVMEADTAKAVRGLLRAQALVPLQVTPVELRRGGQRAELRLERSARSAARSSTPRGWRSGRASSPAWSPPACRWSAP